MLFLVVFFLPHATFAFKNEPRGFRGIQWWTHISKLPEMRFINDKDAVKLYVREEDKLEIGEAKLQDIRYVFHNNRFTKVIIAYISDSNHEALKRTLFGAFGAGHTLGEEGSYYLWPGFRVRLILEYDKNTKVGELEIGARGIFYDEPEIDGAQKVESAAPGL
jgi:hypothetical protein